MYCVHLEEKLIYGVLIHYQVNGRADYMSFPQIKGKYVQRRAMQCGLGLSIFQISGSVNVLNRKQFEDHIHYLDR